MKEQIKELFSIKPEDEGIIFAENTLYYYEMREEIDHYKSLGVSSKILRDFMDVLVTIQAIVNREKPRIYFNFVRNTFDIHFLKAHNDAKFYPDPDKFWFDELTKSGGFLSEYDVVKVKSGAKIIDLFKTFVNGAVIWDENVCATSNVASTISGVENLVPFRYEECEGVYDWFIRKTNTFEEKKNLVGKFTGKGIIPDTDIPSTGSRKCDAYLWAKAMYMDKGLTNETLISNLIDAYPWKNLSETEYYPDLENSCVTNKDYYIAKKAFFVDLNVCPTTVASDEPEQEAGTDFKTLQIILRKQNELANGRVCTYGGFVPWWTKYTNVCKPELPDALTIEVYSGKAFSPYFMISDAEAAKGMANSSVFMHNKIEGQLKQNSKNSDKKLENKNYIMLYMGDFDSAAWTNCLIPGFFNDKAKNEIPISWGINSALSDRIPHVFNYMYKNKGEKDYFVMGNSGAGHMATEFITSPKRPQGLKGTVEEWIKYNNEKAKQFDLDIGGFFIHDGHDVENTIEIYSKIASVGVGSNWPMGPRLINGVPIINAPTASDPTVGVEYVSKFIEDCCEFGGNDEFGASRPTFNSFRCIWTSPSDLLKAIEAIKERRPKAKIEVVDPYTYYRLLKQWLERGIDHLERHIDV